MNDIQTLLDDLTPMFAKPSKNGKKSAESDGGPAPEGNAAGGNTSCPLTDDELIAHIRQSKQGAKFEALFVHGSIAGYPSNSEAVAGLVWILAYWVGRDFDRIDRLYRRSALFTLDPGKWDSKRKQSTWGRNEIESALAGVSKFHDWVRVTFTAGGETYGSFRGDGGEAGGHSAQSANSAGESAPPEWPAPVPMSQPPDVPEFPDDVLPDWMRAFVLAQAEELQVPVDLLALLVLAAASGGISRKVVVTPRAGWDWEPVNLFVLIALLPGERKSQTFNKVFAFLHELEKRLREVAEPIVKEAESDLRVAEGRVKHLEGQISKCDDAEARRELTKCLQDAREELAKVVVPAMPLLRVDDDTPEMLGKEIVQQCGRLVAASPESKTIENISAYSEKPNFDVFLKGHAGDDIRSGRVSRGRDSITRPALTCAYAVQPCVIEGMGGSPEFRGRGVLARWWYSLAVSRVGYRTIGAAAVPKTIRDVYAARMTMLWETDYLDPEECSPHELRFTAEAATALMAFETWVEELLRPGGTLSALGGWGNKLCGLCVRLSGVLHAADGIGTGKNWQATRIPVGVLDRAVRICREHAIPHALAAFDLMGATEAIVNARTLLRWIGNRADKYAEFTKRDVFNGCRASFATVAEMEPALDLLEQHYLIRPKKQEQRSGPGRKPSPEYVVNPAAFTVVTHAQNTHNTHNSGRPPANGGDGTVAHNTQNTHNSVQHSDGLNSADSAYSAREPERPETVPDPNSADSAYCARPDDQPEEPTDLAPEWVIPICGKMGALISDDGQKVYRRKAEELKNSDDPEDDTDEFGKQFERTGRKWKCVPEWLNATHGAGYHAGARFLQVTKDHRKLALAWLKTEPDLPTPPVRGFKWMNELGGGK